MGWMILGFIHFWISLIFATNSLTFFNQNNTSIPPIQQQNSLIYSSEKNFPVISDFDIGYNWAESNDINNFSSCQNKFWTSQSENGCNEYVKKHYTGYRSFHWYECSEDCGGHEAGYDWAEENDISDKEECDWNSDSFIEGCQAYIEENY